MLKFRRFKVALLGMLLVVLPLWAGAQDVIPTLDPMPFLTQEVVPFLVTAPPISNSTEKIMYGMILSGEMLSGTERYYSFDGNAGDAVNIDSLNETCVRLVTPNGAHLANNTLAFGDYYGIGAAVLPETGLYQLIIGGMCEGGVGGFYQIRFLRVSYQLIEYGDSVEGSILGDRQPIVYHFEVSADDIIFIRVKSEGPNFSLNLINSKDNSQIAITSPEHNPFIGPVKITEDGIYIVIVSYPDPYIPMPFTVYIDRPVAQPIQFGVPQEVNFTGQESLYAYSFTGGYGHVGRLWVDSDGSIDTQFLIFTRAIPTAMHEDDDSGAGYDPELEFFPLSNGFLDYDYYIWLLPRTPGSVGHVELGLDLLEPFRIDEEAVEVRTTKKQHIHYLVFEGQAGESVELLVEVIQGTKRGLGVNAQQGDQYLATNRSNFVSTLILSIEPIVDGDVLVSVSTIPFTEATLRVSLMRDE
ncbi:MAG: hypothetical protein K8L97_06795 [Anaerolineae bacterium]|nr:hypothetical protein [Anaerolineae bacterium]